MNNKKYANVINNNIFAKMKFANVLLNMRQKCDNISLKGGKD